MVHTIFRGPGDWIQTLWVGDIFPPTTGNGNLFSADHRAQLERRRKWQLGSVALHATACRVEGHHLPANDCGHISFLNLSLLIFKMREEVLSLCSGLLLGNEKERTIDTPVKGDEPQNYNE